jgi:hypothetical protein
MYDPKPSNEILEDSINTISVTEVKDYIGNNRDVAIDNTLLIDFIAKARTQIEDYLHRSIFIRKYKTTSTCKSFLLVHTVQNIVDVNAITLVDEEEVILSASNDDFDVEFNIDDDIITITSDIENVQYYTATYYSGYKDVPVPILQAIKQHAKISYKRNSDNPMLEISDSIRTFRKLRQNDYR